MREMTQINKINYNFTTVHFTTDTTGIQRVIKDLNHSTATN